MNAHLNSFLILLSLIWPLLLVMLMSVPFLRSVIIRLAPWAAVPALLLGLWVMPDNHSILIAPLLLGGELGFDGAGRLFLLSSSLVWILVGICIRSYFSDQDTLKRVLFFYLLTLTGNLTVILAQDVLVLSTGLALMSFSAYGLITGAGDSSALRAGRTYIILVVLSELLLFEAILMAAQAVDSTSLVDIRSALVDSDTRDLIILLALLGFGIKLGGMVGLHIWIPVSVSATPLPVAVLITTTLIQAGLFGAVQFLPLGHLATPGWGESLIIVGLLSVVYGSGIGMTQQRGKTLLAYVSISQMGLMVSILGLGLLIPNQWPVLLVAVSGYALHLTLTISALLLGLGSDNPKLSRGIWLVMLLPALALAATPVGGGMLAMALFKAQMTHAPEPWNTLLPVAFIVTSFLSSLLMIRLLYLIRPSRDQSNVSLTSGLLWPWLANLALMVILPWWLFTDFHLVSLTLIWQSIWPVIAALIVTLVGLRFKNIVKIPAIPEGDILMGLERLGRYFYLWFSQISDFIFILQKKTISTARQWFVMITEKLR